MARTCKAITRNGRPCAAYATTGADFCFIHDPAMAVKRAEARRAGGLRQRPSHSGANCPDRVRTMADVLSLLDYSLAESLRLENSLARGRLLVAMAEAYVRTLQVGELEARVEALERILLERR